MLIVFTTKKCQIEIRNPHFGQVGFLKKEDGPVEQVFYDKGGKERGPREDGGQFSENQPGWVTLEEFTRRKLARARAWKKSIEGQQDYFSRRAERPDRSTEGRFGSFSFGGIHPHECA